MGTPDRVEQRFGGQIELDIDVVAGSTELIQTAFGDGF